MYLVFVYMCELKALITVCPMKDALPWVFRVEVWATFCFLYFQLNRDLGCGWCPACDLNTGPSTLCLN